MRGREEQIKTLVSMATKSSYRHITGEMLWFMFDRNFVKLASIEDRGNIWAEFDFQLDRTITFGATRP